MTGKKIKYKRVSTEEQNADRQLEGLECDKEFVDYCSGATLDRPELKKMLAYVREDDHIYIHSLDRLGRSVKDLQNIVSDLIKSRITVHFVKEGLIFDGKNNPMSNLMLTILAAIAEFELARMKERQMEGIARAQRAGKYKGRVSKYTKTMIENITAAMQTRKTKKQIAQELGISLPCLYTYLVRIERENGCLQGEFSEKT
jgi:DNA invertase Pin-like site-specific DNA recombinase